MIKPQDLIGFIIFVLGITACAPRVVPVALHKSSALTLTPSSMNLMVGNSYSFTATGGTPPYLFSLVSGTGSIHPTTGQFTASTHSGEVTIQVLDNAQSSMQASISVKEEIKIQPSHITLSTRTGSSYQLSSTGGVLPSLLSILSGPGSISPSGVFSSTMPGTTQIQAIDLIGNSSVATVQNVPVISNGFVKAVVSDSNALYIGGSFTAVNPYVAPKMIALDPANGNPLLGFDIQSGFDNAVKTFVFSGNYVYVGGLFYRYRGTIVNFLAKIDLRTGDLDPAFNQASGLNNTVNALVIANGALYVGGTFTSYRGAPAEHLAKLDLTTGDLDTNFTQSTGTGGGIPDVAALIAYGDSLYLGGWFTTYRGIPIERLAKVNLITGDLDTTFTQATGANGSVNSFAISGSSLFASGWLSSYRGTAVNRLMKVDLASGDLDPVFSTGVGFDTLPSVMVTQGGALFLGGGFTTYQGMPANYLAKVDEATGALDTTFTQAAGFNAGVNVLMTDGAALYVGGMYSSYRNTPNYYLSKLNLTNGDLDLSFCQESGMNGDVYALGMNSSKLYVGGSFGAYRGTPARNLAKLNKLTGAVDTTFTQSTGFNASVNALALTPTDLYVGGGFTSYRGTTIQRLAKLSLTDGALNTTFTQATGANNAVSALAVNDQALFLGGSFSSYRGNTALRLAKVDLTNGDLDTTFTQATGLNNIVNVLLLGNGSLYVGGNFTLYRGTAAQRLAKVDLINGTLDTAFSQAIGFSKDVNALLLSDGFLYVAGGFVGYRGAFVDRLAKIHQNTGDLDTTFTQVPGLDYIASTLVLSGSSLYVGGSFDVYRDLPSENLAKVDIVTGNLDTSFTQSLGFDGAVNVMHPVGDSLLVFGVFSTYRGERAQGFAPINLTTGVFSQFE